MLRIVGGEYSSRRINTLPGGEQTRPTADRVRENIFNILQTSVPNSHVLDLFSGTGAMGIEALSRGAKHCDFVEQNKDAAKLIQSNLDLLKVPPDRYRIFQSDASQFLQLGKETRYCVDRFYDLVFADPPYQSVWYAKALQEVFGSELCSKNCILCIEMDRYTELIGQEHESWFRLTRKKYGKTCLEIWTNSKD